MQKCSGPQLGDEHEHATAGDDWQLLQFFFLKSFMSIERDQIAEDAYAIALASHRVNYPDEAQNARFREMLYQSILDLVQSGMTDRDLLASFGINRARRRRA